MLPSAVSTAALPGFPHHSFCVHTPASLGCTPPESNYLGMPQPAVRLHLRCYRLPIFMQNAVDIAATLPTVVLHKPAQPACHALKKLRIGRFCPLSLMCLRHGSHNVALFSFFFACGVVASFPIHSLSTQRCSTRESTFLDWQNRHCSSLRHARKQQHTPARASNAKYSPRE